MIDNFLRSIASNSEWVPSFTIEFDRMESLLEIRIFHTETEKVKQHDFFQGPYVGETYKVVKRATGYQVYHRN